ncbi:PQ loop repeat domain-containing protein [Hirsutella rhossiliensis]|uniref:PQ loop repeat domain-containing protein n=1 Tax=Hirsutella rhossiliensis TaxID=111463 RepID=A0A9P8N138_9HYPO|nr:PQ loop repeat domain-containing protein [Hirsutella rhossiliensis]KAH0964982.1 PQ loop repeat domain-containing protein [Hirsutella rhossiliensis]
MSGWLAACAAYVAPLFIVISPILSYGDQALAMHRNKSSAGFSLDIPLIMLVASLFRIFYWHGARFDTSLLLQSLIMVAMHLVLLKIALDHRPPPSSKGGDTGVPFAAAAQSDNILSGPRPYNFWQWRSPKPYWQFLLYLAAGLFVLELLMTPIPSLFTLYSAMLGYVGLSVEATLAIPQILANSQTRSCKGFRLSVLVAWLGGDAMKILWFFTTTTDIPVAFKVCGLFQAACDCLLGAQYLMYGEGEDIVKEHPLEEGQWSSAFTHGVRPHSRSFSQTKGSAPYSDSEVD